MITPFVSVTKMTGWAIPDAQDVSSLRTSKASMIAELESDSSVNAIPRRFAKWASDPTLS